MVAKDRIDKPNNGHITGPPFSNSSLASIIKQLEVNDRKLRGIKLLASNNYQ
jgi:hypothetical protein